MINKNVTILLDGGWKISGKIIKKRPDRFFVKQNDEIYMIFKSKISAMLLDNDEKKAKDSLSSKIAVGYHKGDDRNDPYPPGRNYAEEFGQEYAGVSLPSDILIDADDKECRNKNDFSIKFNDNSGNIEITSEEE